MTKSQSVFSSVSTHSWDGIIHGLCLSSLNAAAGMWSKDHHLLLQGQHVYGDGMECDHDWLLGPAFCMCSWSQGMPTQDSPVSGPL